MINKKTVLAKINEIIDEEKGRAVTMDSMFLDAELDSLGTLITFIIIDSEFEIFDKDDAENALENVDIENLTIRDLVTKCILSTTNQSTELKTETPTLLSRN